MRSEFWEDVHSSVANVDRSVVTERRDKQRQALK